MASDRKTDWLQPLFAEAEKAVEKWPEALRTASEDRASEAFERAQQAVLAFKHEPSNH